MGGGGRAGASTLQWFDNFAAWRLIFATLNRLFVWRIFQNRLMRNDFPQVKTEKLLDTEKPQRTSSCALEWLSGESISPLPNAFLKAIPSIIFQKLKTEQIPCLQLWQLRGHIISVKTDELKYFFARTNYDSSINNSRLLLVLCRHWYHGVLQVSSLIITWCLKTKLCILNMIYTSISLNLIIYAHCIFIYWLLFFFLYLYFFFFLWRERAQFKLGKTHYVLLNSYIIALQNYARIIMFFIVLFFVFCFFFFSS